MSAQLESSCQRSLQMRCRPLRNPQHAVRSDTHLCCTEHTLTQGHLTVVMFISLGLKLRDRRSICGSLSLSHTEEQDPIRKSHQAFVALILSERLFWALNPPPKHTTNHHWSPAPTTQPCRHISINIRPAGSAEQCKMSRPHLCNLVFTVFTAAADA
ncbi:hypothetical protein IRJ41_014293 [Triplophysa rosa]|uniref:Uncharacterized protein n=1 Tax=Triplophysa rosa TaxID=992332 RepID=A0A9W7WUW1_TRIRA|nr:hypothetical protein IRJ41_014293 [Triplophysa rosa]